jgi:hypothetical protein
MEMLLSLQSCALFVDHFPRSSRAPEAKTDPPLATKAATLPEKMQGFAPESVFKPDLSHFPTLQDDVVAMMVEVTIMVR